MSIWLIALGHQMPAWVSEAYSTYAKRLTNQHQLILKEILLPKYSKSQRQATRLEKEAKLIRAVLPRHATIVLLDEGGKTWNSQTLASQLSLWQSMQQQLCFLIGGPDGVHTSIKQASAVHWSLSTLTLPHPMVRVIVAEQLYRAYSLNQGHPYHRI